MISGGSQQILYMVTEALCDEGDIVLVENPTYFVYLGILQSHGIQARGIQVDRDGLNLAHLERTLEHMKRSGAIRRLKMLYLVSYFHNPTGLTMSLEKKARALALLRRYERAAGHPIYLLEDAAYRELRFRGEEVPSALVVRGAGSRVIYAGTYSKPFATGVRVGFGVMPEPLFSTVIRIKGNHDFGTANLTQQILVKALGLGIYDAHLDRLRKRYARKSAVMLRAFQQHMPPEVEWWTPDGGLYFWVRLPSGIPVGQPSRVFKDAVRANVLYVPGELCYASQSSRRIPANEMRVSFGGARLADIPEGVARLGKVLRTAVRRAR
jgi:2-aminoadipate transaminase